MVQESHGFGVWEHGYTPLRLWAIFGERSRTAAT
jgi:hypothetical protein